ncbi:MAG: hypothetical protein HY689_01385 [Chloroflexi bacterium]|nr:hypothetical protein [Chloroflexota bacterium]
MAEALETVVTLEVPPTDSPDDVTAFVRQLERSLAPEHGVRLELETVGRRRFLHLRRTPVAAPASPSGT